MRTDSDRWGLFEAYHLMGSFWESNRRCLCAKIVIFFRAEVKPLTSIKFQFNIKLCHLSSSCKIPLSELNRCCKQHLLQVYCSVPGCCSCQSKNGCRSSAPLSPHPSTSVERTSKMHGSRNSHTHWFWFTNYIIFIKSVKSNIHMVVFESLTTNIISRTKSLKKCLYMYKSAVIHLLHTNRLPSAPALKGGWWRLNPVKSIKCVPLWSLMEG